MVNNDNITIKNTFYNNMKEACSNANNYNYALVYMMSNLYLTKVNKLQELDYDEILEARFFDEHGELHIFPEFEGYRAVEVESYCEANDKTIHYPILDSDICVDTEFKKNTKVTIRKYINFDEDGQVCIDLTRCVKLIEE